MSADRPPSNLDRVQDKNKITFMGGGLVIDIQPPELNLRVKILKRKLLKKYKMNFNEN